MFPLLSPATHNEVDGQVIAVISLPLSNGVPAGWPEGGPANSQALGEVELGLIEVSKLPLLSPAAHSVVDWVAGAHPSAKIDLPASTATDDQGPVDGVVDSKMFPVASPEMQEAEDAQAIESRGVVPSIPEDLQVNPLLAGREVIEKEAVAACGGDDESLTFTVKE
jgi:hypothetical protein